MLTITLSNRQSATVSIYSITLSGRRRAGREKKQGEEKKKKKKRKESIKR